MFPLVSVNEFKPLIQEISRSFTKVVALNVKEPSSAFPPRSPSIMYGLDMSSTIGLIEEKYLEQVEYCEVRQEAQAISVGFLV